MNILWSLSVLTIPPHYESKVYPPRQSPAYNKQDQASINTA